MNMPRNPLVAVETSVYSHDVEDVEMADALDDVLAVDINVNVADDMREVAEHANFTDNSVVPALLEPSKRLREPPQLVFAAPKVRERNVDFQVPHRLLIEHSALTPRGFERKEEHLLGSGGFASVYRAEFEGRLVAVKYFHDRKSTEEVVKQLHRELNTFQVSHPNLLQLIGVSISDTGAPCVITEIMDGSLEMLLNRPPVPVPFAVQVLLQIANGMSSLHASGIVHRDLKMANVLYRRLTSGDVEIKVADFGLTRVPEAKMTNFVGTYFYCAPEVMDSNQYGLSADVFSFGILMWELLTGCHAYENDPAAVNRFILARAVIDGKRPPTEYIPASVPLHLKEFMQRCWDPCPTARPNFGDICAYLSHYLYL